MRRPTKIKEGWKRISKGRVQRGDQFWNWNSKKWGTAYLSEVGVKIEPEWTVIRRVKS